MIWDGDFSTCVGNIKTIISVMIKLPISFEACLQMYLKDALLAKWCCVIDVEKVSQLYAIIFLQNVLINSNIWKGKYENICNLAYNE